MTICVNVNIVAWMLSKHVRTTSQTMIKHVPSVRQITTCPVVFADHRLMCQRLRFNSFLFQHGNASLMYSGYVSGGGLVVNLTAALNVHSFYKEAEQMFSRAKDKSLTAYWRRTGWIRNVHRLPVSVVTDDRIIREALVLKIFKLTNIERRILRIL